MANTAQTDVLLLGSRVAGVLTGVTAAQTSMPVNLKTYPLASIYVRASGGTISSGTLVIEQAWWDPISGDQPYGGQWSALQTITLSTLSGTDQQQAFNVGAEASGFVRVRLSAAVVGGGTIYAALTALGNS